MNETLTVRDFGPIRNAEVTFKRVTVFIGPTGGGKSTLAKLAAVFRDKKLRTSDPKDDVQAICQGLIRDYELTNFDQESSFVELAKDSVLQIVRRNQLVEIVTNDFPPVPVLDNLHVTIPYPLNGTPEQEAANAQAILNAFVAALSKEEFFVFQKRLEKVQLRGIYVPAERVFYGSISSSLAGLMRDDIGLPKSLLGFVNALWQARKVVSDLDLPMFGVKYEYRNEQDKIRLPDREEALHLNETASGIQAVAPLLVLLEHLSRQTERLQSFIIEEPELNLFPEAQQALVQTLIEKCTQGENDLIITTHSPYVLTVLNTLMYAHKVAHEVPANAKKVEKLVPRKYWIDPAQFAAYYVDLPSTKKKQQVRSIIDKKTGMIGENELDNLSFTLADLLGKLLDLRTPPKAKAPEKVQA